MIASTTRPYGQGHALEWSARLQYKRSVGNRHSVDSAEPAAPIDPRSALSSVQFTVYSLQASAFMSHMHYLNLTSWALLSSTVCDWLAALLPCTLEEAIL